jgi:hypothetical protein
VVFCGFDGHSVAFLSASIIVDIRLIALLAADTLMFVAFSLVGKAVLSASASISLPCGVGISTSGQ